jgi:hypothetical protein
VIVDISCPRSDQAVQTLPEIPDAQEESGSLPSEGDIADIDLKRIVCKILTRHLFDECVQAQESRDELPLIRVPSGLALSLKRDPDYCELIADVIGELAEDTDLTRLPYEEFLDDILALLHRSNRDRSRTILRDLEEEAEGRAFGFDPTFCMRTADLLADETLDFVLNI